MKQGKVTTAAVPRHHRTAIAAAAPDANLEYSVLRVHEPSGYEVLTMVRRLEGRRSFRVFWTTKERVLWRGLMSNCRVSDGGCRMDALCSHHHDLLGSHQVCGFSAEEVQITCWDGGRLLITAEPREPRSHELWRIKPIRR